jgi:hypothetical protein
LSKSITTDPSSFLEIAFLGHLPAHGGLEQCQQLYLINGGKSKPNWGLITVASSGLILESAVMLVPEPVPGSRDLPSLELTKFL